VELSGPVPAGSPFTGGEVLASTVFTPGLASSDVSVPLSVTLPPGDYAIIFGSGLLGATAGIGAMAQNNVVTPAGSGSYFGWSVANGSIWITSTSPTLFGDARFTVNGNVLEDGSSPTIKITKTTINGDGSFDFTIFNATNPANSTAVNIPDTSINNMTTPLSVQADSYSVTEAVPLNWNLISSDCLINGISQGSTLNFNLINDDSVECIFVNEFIGIGGPPVGGTIIPIDTTALLVAGSQTISPWLILGILSAVGIGLAIFTIKRR